jgi:hypothetical protein
MDCATTRTRTALLCLALVCVPAVVYSSGRFCIWVMGLVGTAGHLVPCPLCHGTRAFHAFYALQFRLAAEENLFVCACLIVGNAAPVLLSATVMASRSEDAQRRLVRMTAWACWPVFAAGLALLAAQWLINLHRMGVSD